MNSRPEFTAPASWREATGNEKAVASYRTPQDRASPLCPAAPLMGKEQPHVGAREPISVALRVRTRNVSL